MADKPALRGRLISRRDRSLMKSINGPSKTVTAATSVPSSWTQAAGCWAARPGAALPVTSGWGRNCQKPTAKPQQGQQLQAGRGKELPSLYSTTGGGNGTAETPPRSGLPRVSPPCRTLEAELLPVRAVARAAQPGAGQLLVDGLQDPHVHRLAVIQATWQRGFPSVTPGTPPLSPPGGTGATPSGRGMPEAGWERDPAAGNS